MSAPQFPGHQSRTNHFRSVPYDKQAGRYTQQARHFDKASQYVTQKVNVDQTHSAEKARARLQDKLAKKQSQDNQDNTDTIIQALVVLAGLRS